MDGGKLPVGAQLDTVSRATSAKAAQTLKAGGGGDDAKLTEAARDLESVFLKMVFDEMDRTVDSDGGMFPRSPGMDMFQGWFRAEVAKQWAQNGGTGLGDMIADQLRESGGASAGAGAAGPAGAARGVKRGGAVTQLSTAVGAPVSGRLTSGFGHRRHPVHGGGDFHKGIDIAAPIGTPVKSPFAGTVAKVGENPYLGKYVMVDHPGGFRSVYGHNSEITVKAGDTIAAGHPIARSGNSGRSTGPHVHYGLFKDGKPVDPMRWIGAGAKRSGGPDGPQAVGAAQTLAAESAAAHRAVARSPIKPPAGLPIKADEPTGAPGGAHPE